jgi:hypothetical protein
MLVTVGWWPPDIEFDLKDLNTVAKVIEDRNREHGRRK